MNELGWILDPEKEPASHWVDLIYKEDEFDDGNLHWFRAAVKWDGCIHLYMACNEPFTTRNEMDNRKEDDTDYLHICDLDALIYKLLKLREKAKEEFIKFGREWPDS